MPKQAGTARPRTKAGRAARVQRVASGVLAGRKITQIAADQGLSRATASKLANSPAVQLLVTALVEVERTQIRALFKKGLKAVEESFRAKRYTVYEGAKIDLGPDHFARLTGVKRLTELLTAGRTAQKPDPPPRKTITVDELRQVLYEAENPGSK